ncbi:cytochrome P450 [Gloeopeniophorella convolvens]|nr:cytochrome P450 [Gloeopeniophorella convolvens]
MSLLTNLYLAPAVATAGLVLYIAYWVISSKIRNATSPLRDLPGPPRDNWATGSFREVREFESVAQHEEWEKQYGPVFRYHSFFGTDKVRMGDPKGVNHVLSHTQEFHKSVTVRIALGQLLGKGLLFVEGDRHKQQRRVISPAFGPLQIRKFAEMFVNKSNQLRDIWGAQVAESKRKDGKVKLDAFVWLNKASLDMIGLAGFNYDFDALHVPEDKPNALNEAVQHMVQFPNPLFFFVQIFFPLFRLLPSERARTTEENLKVIRDIGMKMIAEKKAAVLSGASTGADGKAIIEKKDVQDHDLLSLLIKSNLARDMPENQRMSDEDIMHQVPTFLVAGHETTSTGLTWTLFALSTRKDVQAKLREELLSLPTDTPTLDQLNSLKYLDCVIREALRLHAPVNITQRDAVVDTVIPLSKPFIDNKGIERHELRVRKGDTIQIPIQELNRSEEFWGEDAMEFKPERWLNLPETVSGMPGIWSNILTFIAGPHACIGYQFSIAEMKAMLFAIVRTFEFELAIQPDEIARRDWIVGRPHVATMLDAGAQLPLLVSLAKKD